MIADSYYLDKYGWNVDVLFDVTCDDMDEAVGWLSDIGAGEGFVRFVKDKFDECLPNIGLTYSNLLSRETIVMVGNTTGDDELLNTVVHENMHAAMHISEALGFDPYGEEPCYIAGNLAALQSDTIKCLLS